MTILGNWFLRFPSALPHLWDWVSRGCACETAFRGHISLTITLVWRDWKFNAWSTESVSLSPALGADNFWGWDVDNVSQLEHLRIIYTKKRFVSIRGITLEIGLVILGIWTRNLYVYCGQLECIVPDRQRGGALERGGWTKNQMLGLTVPTVLARFLYQQMRDLER